MVLLKNQELLSLGIETSNQLAVFIYCFLLELKCRPTLA